MERPIDNPKTITTLAPIPPAHVVLQDLATLVLDVAALEKGYRRPRRSRWARCAPWRETCSRRGGLLLPLTTSDVGSTPAPRPRIADDEEPALSLAPRRYGHVPQERATPACPRAGDENFFIAHRVKRHACVRPQKR